MNNKDIDVFIISFNRLTYLRSLVFWLEKAGFEKIHIVDNNSSYPPLLEYLASSRNIVHRMNKNFGHLVVWECGKFKEIIDSKNYIVTDCDILPVEECPLNITEYFFKILEKYNKMTKVGFGLKIDDIPEKYQQKENVIEWEKQFWKKELESGLFDASIDTTLALYRPGIYPTDKRWWRSIRTSHPFISRHLPWYEDSNEVSSEDLYYQQHLKNSSSFWSISDVVLLKKYNKELSFELESVYSSKKWKYLQILYKQLNRFCLRNRFEKKIGKKNELLIKNIDDVAELQKLNKKLTVELGSIKNSDGWLAFQKIDDFIDENIMQNRLSAFYKRKVKKYVPRFIYDSLINPVAKFLRDSIFFSVDGRKKQRKFPESKLAHKYLDGLTGLEIGGSIHNPFGLKTRNVDFSDTLETEFKQSEINRCGEALPVDIIAPGDMIPVSDESEDFVISAHVLEHFPDPIKALKEWYRIIKPGGYIFTIVPHKERTFDRNRERTSLEELIRRHEEGFCPEIDNHIHYSVWVTEDLIELVDYLGWALVDARDVDDKVGNGFTIVIKK